MTEINYRKRCILIFCVLPESCIFLLFDAVVSGLSTLCVMKVWYQISMFANKPKHFVQRLTESFYRIDPVSNDPYFNVLSTYKCCLGNLHLT